MRCSGWSSLAISVCSALLLAAPASAHVIATPGFIASGSSESVTFSGPNEREQPMTSFSITMPSGIEIEHAHPVEGWTEEFTSSSATWTGGPLPPRLDIAFGLTLKATADPGIVELQTEQHYPEGAVADWPVSLTVVPGAESPSENLALAGAVGLMGVLVVVGVAVLAWRRRS